MQAATATPLWRAICPFCSRELQFQAAVGASPTVLCGACHQRFDAETRPATSATGGSSRLVDSNGDGGPGANSGRNGGPPPSQRSPASESSHLKLSESEQIDLAIAMSLSDAFISELEPGTPLAQPPETAQPQSQQQRPTPAPDFWKCPKCVCSNAAHVQRCVCGFEPKAWMLGPGGAVNGHGAPQANGGGRGEGRRPRALAEADGGGVPCPQCTLLNRPGSRSCEACEASLPGGGRGQSAGAGGASGVGGGSGAGGPSAPRAPAAPAPGPPPRAAVVRQNSENSLSVERRQAAQEAESRALVAQIERTCAAHSCSFVDDSFRPFDGSIYLDSRDWARSDVAERNQRQAEARVTQWLRPEEIRRGNTSFDLFNQPWCVFRGEPLPDDVKQGTLGDCWLLSAIAVLAERPPLLRALFPGGAQLSRAGVYPVRLCLDGEWRVIVVDDMLPCTRHGILAFSQAARRQLYVPLLEKAWAKAYGCYEAIEAGTCDEALAALTGAPCEQLRLQPREGSGETPDPDMLWARLLSFREAGFLAGASCGSRDAAAMRAAEALGLQTMHAYSVLDVRAVEGGHRLVQLHNPWGRGEWKGAWADGAPQWTDALRSQLRPADSPEGSFWMGWQDFLRHFREVDVCKVRPADGAHSTTGWMEARVRALMPTSEGPDAPWDAFTLELFETTALDLVLSQRNSRGRDSGSESQQVDLSVAIFKAVPSTGNSSGSAVGDLVASSPRRVHPSVCCEVMLSAGEYLVVPVALNQLHGPGPGRAVVLAAFSAKPVVLARQAASASLVRDALTALVRARGEKSSLFAGDMAVYNLSDGAGSLVYAENRSWMQRFTVSVDARNSFNLVSSRGTMQLEDSLAPGQGQLILALTQLEPSDGYSSSFQFSFRADLGREYHLPEVPQSGGIHSAMRALPATAGSGHGGRQRR